VGRFSADESGSTARERSSFSVPRRFVRERHFLRFDTATQTFIVYIDATLFVDAAPERKPRVAVWNALSAAFQLHGQRVCFATDPHYCIDIWEEYGQADFPHGR
jgi:hypothetical protein